MLKMMQYKLSSIPLWRKILFIIVIVAFVFIDVKGYQGFELTLLEFIVFHFNDSKTIDYFYLIIIMIISADIYNGAQNPYEDMLILKNGGRKKWFIYISIYTALASFGIICIYLLVACILGFSSGFLGLHLGAYLTELKNLNSILIIGEIVMLAGLRIWFLNMLIMSINLFCMNSPMGFLAAFIISIIDMFIYEAFDIMEPWGIMPLEHTRIIYTEAVAPAVDQFVRFPVGYSVLYWAIGILTFVVISYRAILRKEFLIKNVKY